MYGTVFRLIYSLAGFRLKYLSMPRVKENIYKSYISIFQFLTYSTDPKKTCERKVKLLLLTYANVAYKQNLSICKSCPCVQGFSKNIILMTAYDEFM